MSSVSFELQKYSSELSDGNEYINPLVLKERTDGSVHFFYNKDTESIIVLLQTPLHMHLRRFPNSSINVVDGDLQL